MITCTIGSIQYQDIKIGAGEDHNIPLTFTDSDGSALDLTNYVIYYSAKKFMTQSTDDILKTISVHTSPTEGQSTIPLVTSDSSSLRGAYYHSILLHHSVNGIDVLVLKGTLIVEAITTTAETS